MVTHSISEVEPPWWLELRRLFEAGVAHCFLIGGNIHGVTAYHGMSQQAFLQAALQAVMTRDVMIWYSPTTGITFPFPEMRQKTLDILGPEWQPPASSDDPYAAALDAVGVRASPQDIFASARKPAQAIVILNDVLHSPLAARYEERPDGGQEVQGRVVVILDQADLLIPATTKAQMSDERLNTLAILRSWGHDPMLTRQQNPVLFLTSHLHDIHPDLRASSSGFRVVEQPLPDETTRHAYLTWYLQEHRRVDPIPLIDLTVEELARITAGLDLRQVEDVLLVAARHAEGVSRIHVKERKDAIIRQEFSENITMLDPLPGGFTNLGGLETFVTWFRQEVQGPLRAGRFQEVPKGILLAGPPGVGKTLIASALATELGYNAIEVHMSQILGGIVGTSEHNLDRVFHLVRDLAPSILFIDEIEQTALGQVRGQSSGSPVASNLFGAMLRFFGDESLRGRVIVVGATNQPESIDPALRRAGRFDVTFPIFCQDLPGRLEILAIQARQQGIALEASAQRLLAQETERYSGADLAALVKEARLLALHAGNATITEGIARDALMNVRPATLGSVHAFTQSAIEACTNLRYLPPAVAEAERARLMALRQPPAATEPGPRSSTRHARQL